MIPFQPTSSSSSPAFIPQGAITFFYYQELAPAVEFYLQVVGLKMAEHLGWCAILELQPRTYVGLVNATAGSQRPIDGPNKGAVLSIETADLEECLERMKRIGAVAASTVLEPGCYGRTVEFKILDPGGYTVEFFRWLQPLPDRALTP